MPGKETGTISAWNAARAGKRNAEGYGFVQIDGHEDNKSSNLFLYADNIKDSKLRSEAKIFGLKPGTRITFRVEEAKSSRQSSLATEVEPLRRDGGNSGGGGAVVVVVAAAAEAAVSQTDQGDGQQAGGGAVQHQDGGDPPPRVAAVRPRRENPPDRRVVRGEDRLRENQVATTGVRPEEASAGVAAEAEDGDDW
eukprot:CAMPEP_0206555460 /NCGR_PEP_ID=MMETSP0325_2-20121206/17809_1 /ASSEMBLY_ACC=CAM_ASM_000347 /TAXON_ID=2866 /ORGANISM="Crypthecodinium cohnii, Strain Seligo" /LENGTH=194 /DNA_ID=CAMNT_0054055769 /DNA_START=86 /DNA_END=667 /DNA_ORIENTATION=-